MRGRVNKSDYALYKGDDLLLIGSINEISEYLGVDKKTVRWYSSPASYKRHNGKGTYVIKIEDDE